ncbi:MAG: response regulator [Oligoflexus sp.]
MVTDRYKTVLIVDDEKQLRDIVRFDLRKLPLNILEAENGRQALDISGLNTIDLVISDVRMPVATGVELLKELRENNPGHPPFVFMTAFSDVSSEEALDLGAEAFLRKPLDKQELLEVVQKALVPKSERWSRTGEPKEGARFYDFTSEIGTLSANFTDTGQIEIGQGGMFVEVTTNLPTSFEVLHFRVDSHDSKLGVVEGLGQVRWVRRSADEDYRSGFGVEFLQLDAIVRHNLLQYLKTFRPKAYIPLGKAQRKTS